MTLAGPRPRPTPGPVWIVGAVLCAGVGLVSYRYLIPGSPGLSPGVVANGATRFGALVIHAGFAATALILGPWQFLPRLRARHPRIHRWTGRLYVVSCLIAACAGLALAAGTTAGRPATVGFGLLAVAWIAVTGRAWMAARRRDFAVHRRFMVRSFALTFAAVTLRLYLPVALVLPLNEVVAYQAISFLCWVPNFIVAELYLRRP